jgi:hypothetical protein
VGVTVDIDDLDAFEIEYLTFISSEFARLESVESKKRNLRSGKR